jgi:hypothetical protein
MREGRIGVTAEGDRVLVAHGYNPRQRSGGLQLKASPGMRPYPKKPTTHTPKKN